MSVNEPQPRTGLSKWIGTPQEILDACAMILACAVLWAIAVFLWPGGHGWQSAIIVVGLACGVRWQRSGDDNYLVLCVVLMGVGALYW